MSNTAIWDVLSKTNPAHTKGFKRGGGFSGTAIKPQWVISRLTEEFGPVGVGWGHNEPSFQIVPGDNREVLVYCTLQCWHTDRANTFYGVGGDKVVTYIKANEQYNRPERWENDDEAFKKAFTDAAMNAFKFLGVAADVHMGLFDDSKYVQEMREEFKPESAPKPEPKKMTLADRANLLEDALRNAPVADLDKAWAKGSALCAELDLSMPERLVELTELYGALKDPMPFD